MDGEENDSLLRLFTSLWASTILISLVASPYWFDYVLLVNALPVYADLALAAVALIALYRPSLKTLLLLLSAQVLETLYSMPNVPNHRTLMTFVSVAFLASYLISAKKNKSPALHSNQFFPEAMKISRVTFIVVYFFAALAKMNTGYMDPSTSCSVKFYANVVNWFPFLPEGKFFNSLSIYGPIVVEILVPIGLLSRRFRKKSILVGLLFHFVLALDLTKRFLNFSMVVSVLYLLFLDRSYLETLEEKWRRHIPEHAILFGFIILFGFGFFQVMFTATTHLIIVEHLLWTQIFAGMFLAVYNSPPPTGNEKVPLSFLQIVIVVLVFINGSSPYLGTKTRTSFNMYSNLRIEPNFSNHYFMGPSLDPFGNLADSVIIQKIEPADSQSDDFKEGMRLTYFEFSRYLASQSDTKLNVTYSRKGETLRADSENSLTPPSWIASKLLIYRPLGEAVVNECIW